MSGFRVFLAASVAVLALPIVAAYAARPALSSAPVLTQSVVTAAATAALEGLGQGIGYPAQWTWDPLQTAANPASATSGTPKVEQYRNGTLIATYGYLGQGGPNCGYLGDGTDWQHPSFAAASGCGPFGRAHAWRLWAPGDVFKVYPAVYTGDGQQPWMGPMFDGPEQYNANMPTALKAVTIQGVVVNNTRPVIYLNTGASYTTLSQAPVYFDVSQDMVFSDINVIGAPGMGVGKAGVYISGAANLTIARCRISGFENQDGGANGLFGTAQNNGYLLFDQVVLDHNGGNNGPAHNAYINTSASDPNFSVTFRHSWSHDASYGHLFKSRAQRTIILGNYFQGGMPQAGLGQAENYLLDVPNGGILVVRNNVFVKNASGPNSNGMSVTYAMEGVPDSRPLSVEITNNTFVGFANTYDGSHSTFPLSFYYPQKVPGSSAWPTNVSFTIQNNAFVGYPVTGAPVIDYRGDLSLTEAFSELKRDFSLATPYLTETKGNIGRISYGHATSGSAVRTTPLVGARD